MILENANGYKLNTKLLQVKLIISCYPKKEHTRKREGTPIVTPLIYLLNIQARIKPFNHQKRHTQTILMILNRFKLFPWTMTP